MRWGSSPHARTKEAALLLERRLFGMVCGCEESRGFDAEPQRAR